LPKKKKDESKNRQQLKRKTKKKKAECKMQKGKIQFLVAGKFKRRWDFISGPGHKTFVEAGCGFLGDFRGSFRVGGWHIQWLHFVFGH